MKLNWKEEESNKLKEENCQMALCVKDLKSKIGAIELRILRVEEDAQVIVKEKDALFGELETTKSSINQ